MNKLLLVILLLAAPISLTSGSPGFWDEARLAPVRNGIARQDPDYLPAYEALKKFCDAELGRPPYSVMQKQYTPPSGDKHDYVSMGRYWWPDPTKPDGLPYIRRDGHSNPMLKELDRDRMGKMMSAVERLALMYDLSGERRYGEKAAELLRVWFLAPESRMNPHLLYGQFVPGHNDNRGRAEGLLDTYGMVEMLTGVDRLIDGGLLSAAEAKALREWFSELLDWMLTSKQGIAEAKTKNNHAIAYDVQIVAFARFTGRTELADETLRKFAERRIFSQIQPDGSQPRELARATGFGYSIYNLKHMLDMCLLAGERGPELYACTSEDGRSIRTAIAYMARYLDRPQEEFPYEQIKDWDSVQGGLAWILLRATRFDPNTNYREAFFRHYPTPGSDLGYLLHAPELR